VNYHVDLLLDSERRSASPVSVGMVLRLMAFTLLATLMTVILLLFVASQDAERKANEAKARWALLQPKHAELLALRAKRNELRADCRQMDGNRLSRMELGPELLRLQRGISPEVQLLAVRINQFAGNQKTGAAASRSYEMRLSGKMVGDKAEVYVEGLRAYLVTSARSNSVESVVIPNNGFRRETVRKTGGDTRSDWFFDLVCRYRSRSFE
jgi:hypothetical protein